MKALLGVRSHFSIGESVFTIKKIVEFAAEHQVEVLALADTMSISGLAEFTKLCDEHKVKPIFGCRLRVVPDATVREKQDSQTFYPKVWIMNDEGLKDLFRLLTSAYSQDHFYYVPRVGRQEFIDTVARGNLLVTTGDFHGLFGNGDLRLWEELVKVAPGNVVVEIQPINTPYFDRVNHIAIAEARKHGIEFFANYPALYKEGMADTRDVLQAICGNQKMSSRTRHINYVRDFHPGVELEHLQALCDALAVRSAEFDGGAISGADALAMVENRKRFIERLEWKWQKMPVSLPKLAEDEFATLVEECKKGWVKRFTKPVLGHKPDPSMQEVYKKRLQYELSVIKKMGFERYFLVVQDLVRWSKENGVRVGPGRGSVGGSLVAYLMGITDVDPIRFNLLFERFINPDRIDLPDADLDFQSTKRERVIKYLVDKYGSECVAGISNFSTLASASALRDTGRVFDLPQKDLGVTKLVPKEHGKPVELDEAAEEVAPLAEFKVKYPEVWKHAVGLEGVMKNLARHAAGVVVAGEPLVNRAVVETNRGDPVVNWDKQYVEDFGLVKIDILGLSTLDVLDLAAQYIRERHGIEVDFLSLPLDDEKVMEAFGKGKTVGVFQFESPGMRKLLRDLAFDRPLTFEDLSAATSLFRPGPKDSGLLDDYVAIKQGLKTPFYEHPNMRAALESTQGVLIYQEQVMQIARDLCGYTFAEADKLRKIMGKKLPEEMAKQRDKFVQGAVETAGMPEDQANALFDKISNFAAYGFNRSHAVEYSVISYWTMWLKVYYPAEFFAATLSVLGDDKLEGLVKDARSYGVEVAPPDITVSTRRFEIVHEGGVYKLLAPLNRVKGISDNATQAILETRERLGGFKSLKDLDEIPRRIFNKRHREALEKVGALVKLIPGSKPAMHPDRRKDQMELLPGLIIDYVKMDRAIVTGDVIKAMLIEQVVKPIQDCKGCSLAGGVHPRPRLGKKAKFMVITDCPNYSEENANAMLSGKASEFTLTALNSAGLSIADGYFTALVKSPKSEKMLTTEQINGCKGYLQKELEILKPPIIVALGSATVQHFVPGLKGGAAENAGKVVYNPTLDANIVVGFNPAIIAFRPEEQVKLNEIFQLVAELIS